MELHFVQNGNINKSYVSCKSIYENGMSSEEIAQLLFGLNDCKKWDYFGKYTGEGFIKYVTIWSELGVTVNINNSAFVYFRPKKECPQIYQIDAKEKIYQPSKESGVFFSLEDGRIDFMPYLTFIPWAWDILNNEMKETVIDKLNWAK